MCANAKRLIHKNFINVYTFQIEFSFSDLPKTKKY